MTARILVVDDESDLEALILQSFRRRIRDGEISFLFARDGIDALATLEANHDIDLVISDIRMPRMDGLAFLKQLQEGDNRVSTIIVSAYGDMANIRAAMNQGAFDFLTKPIDLRDFEATIAKTLRHVELLREAQRRQSIAERAQASLSRYFSPKLAERLATDADAIDLGGQRREIASLFTGVAGFTTLVETLEPDVLGPLLNEYLTGMAEIVFEHDGTLVRINGDALHVLFGAPTEQPDHADRAIACALALDVFAREFSKDWNQRGLALGVTQIGVHAGPAIVGNFGGKHYFDYTAHGDTINIAARLEAVNQQLGTSVCVSSTVAMRASGFRGRPVGDLILRGRTAALSAFEPLRPKQHEDAATQSYRGAFAKLAAGDGAAMAAFAAHVGQHPDDLLASFHLKRLLNGGAGVRIAVE